MFLLHFFLRGLASSLSLSSSLIVSVSLIHTPHIFTYTHIASSLPSFELTSCMSLVNLPRASFCFTFLLSKMRIHLPHSNAQQGCCDD